MCPAACRAEQAARVKEPSTSFWFGTRSVPKNTTQDCFFSLKPESPRSCAPWIATISLRTYHFFRVKGGKRSILGAFAAAAVARTRPIATDRVANRLEITGKVLG